MSCTVTVDNSPFCVHNGGWMDCSACDKELSKEACIINTVCSKLDGPKRPPVCVTASTA